MKNSDKIYIKDNDKVRRCDKNIAKMSHFEFIMHEIFTWNVKNEFKYALKQGVSDLWDGLLNIFAVMLFPITLTSRAIYTIKDAKKSVKDHEEYLEHIKEMKEDI